ncbi:PREDICTED: uncharacterized protein LOC101295939 [Fragaria vesca subsp. vesca]|uniref:uncharacterized protein LOC101295939 n=1 Tax=Fragaria vesca subsp. vesca TaxID=101020 RepID=UPI0002C33F61|nr:PREDICTED: uncharacterized protein LOC101295939 [Fragaria vesca subsp. vesca]
MDDQNKDEAIEVIEEKGQRLMFTDKARKRIYSVKLVQFLNYIPGPYSEELDFVRSSIGSAWAPVVLSCKNILMCRLDSRFHLVNPLTKEMKKVPNSPQTKKSYSWEVHGFGFDDSTNQYKVVEAKGCTDGLVFSVYESLTDSWRKIKGMFPYKEPRLCKKSGTVLNGGVHWFVKRDESLVIICFRLAEEEVTEIQVPPNWNNQTVELGLFRDSYVLHQSQYQENYAVRRFG